MHPDVDIYVAALDDHLNENGYIVPGLGDAGRPHLRHQVKSASLAAKGARPVRHLAKSLFISLVLTAGAGFALMVFQRYSFFDDKINQITFWCIVALFAAIWLAFLAEAFETLRPAARPPKPSRQRRPAKPKKKRRALRRGARNLAGAAALDQETGPFPEQQAAFAEPAAQPARLRRLPRALRAGCSQSSGPAAPAGEAAPQPAERQKRPGPSPNPNPGPRQSRPQQGRRQPRRAAGKTGGPMRARAGHSPQPAPACEPGAAAANPLSPRPLRPPAPSPRSPAPRQNPRPFPAPPPRAVALGKIRADIPPKTAGQAPPANPERPRPSVSLPPSGPPSSKRPRRKAAAAAGGRPAKAGRAGPQAGPGAGPPAAKAG